MNTVKKNGACGTLLIRLTFLAWNCIIINKKKNQNKFLFLSDGSSYGVS